MAITRGMKKALTHKAGGTTNPVATVKNVKTKIPRRVHPMCTRNSALQQLTEIIEELDDDDDLAALVERLYSAENEILRLSNLNNSLTLRLQNTVETHNDLTARLVRLEALLPPPPPGHPVPIKVELTDDIN